jgi:hypothetical protein
MSSWKRNSVSLSPSGLVYTVQSSSDKAVCWSRRTVSIKKLHRAYLASCLYNLIHSSTSRLSFYPHPSFPSLLTDVDSAHIDSTPPIVTTSSSLLHLHPFPRLGIHSNINHAFLQLCTHWRGIVVKYSFGTILKYYIYIHLFP